MRTAVLFHDAPSDRWTTRSRVFDHLLEFVAENLPDRRCLSFTSTAVLLDEIEANDVRVVVTTAEMGRETAFCLRGLGTVIIVLGDAGGLEDLADVVINPLMLSRRDYFTGPTYLVKETLHRIPPADIAAELGLCEAELRQIVQTNVAEFEIVDIIGLCRLLDWDSKFFGFPVAYVTALRLTPAIERQIREFARAHDVRFLEYRCNCHDPVSIETAERNGYGFVDVRMTFNRSIGEGDNAPHIVPRDGVTVRRAVPEDCEIIVPIAQNIYRDSRYYFDGRFDPETLRVFYGDWLRKAVSGTFDDFAMVICDSNVPVGFCTLRQRPENPQSTVIGLFGMAASHAGRGLAHLLIDCVLRELADLGARSVDVVTQGRNYRAQQLYQRAGFTTKSVELWYHKWF